MFSKIAHRKNKTNKTPSTCIFTGDSTKHFRNGYWGGNFPAV